MKLGNDWFTDKLPDFLKDKLDGEANSAVKSITAKYANFQLTGERADPFYARKFFLLTFLKDNEMREAFIRAFGIYTQLNFDRFPALHKIIYVPENESCLPGMEIISRGLNIVYSDALLHTQMAVDLFTDFYKTHFKKEYNQVKRFSTITFDDLHALTEGYDSKIDAMCRIICMGEMLDIKIDESVDKLYLVCEDLESTNFHPLSKKQAMTYPSLSNDVDEVLYKECSEKAASYVESALLKKINKWVRFYNACLNYDNYPSIDGEVYGSEYTGLFDVLTDVIYILEKLKLEYTEDDLCHYMVLRLISVDYTDRLDYTFDSLDTILGLILKKEHFDIVEKLRTSAKEEPKKEVNTKVATPIPAEAQNTIVLEEQIRALQLKLREKEQDIENLHSLYAEEKKENIKLSSLVEKSNSSKAELAALRSFVYNLTQEDIEAPSLVPEEEMVKVISENKIAIVGGHVNWVNKMKEALPSIKYFSPEIKTSASPQALNGFKRVYFFTDTIGHPQYYKFFDLAESSGAKIGYIHGVNIKRTMQTIYNDIAR